MYPACSLPVEWTVFERTSGLSLEVEMRSDVSGETGRAEPSLFALVSNDGTRTLSETSLSSRHCLPVAAMAVDQVPRGSVRETDSLLVPADEIVTMARGFSFAYTDR